MQKKINLISFNNFTQTNDLQKTDILSDGKIFKTF